MTMSEFVDACALEELPAGQLLAVEVAGIALALVRDGDHVYAIQDACSHADVALSEGELSGCMLECWLHGSQFDLRTGEPTSPPAVDAVPIYPIRLVGDAGAERIEVRVTPMSPEEIETANANGKA
jgi:3-phenylpropionate/trans-cinnamate dioxygenase ferredoxin component